MRFDTLTIMKKELTRFFKDTRVLFASVILPGILIYVLYSFMGSAMQDKFEADAGFVPSVSIENMPESVAPWLENAPLTHKVIDEAQGENLKADIAEKSDEILVVFPKDFDRQIESYDPQSGEAAPNVEIYYNSMNTNSSVAADAFIAMMDGFENSMSNKFDINAGDNAYDLASEKDLTGMVFSSMMPMLLMMFLFSGCMSVAPESIAGEKERGTVAALLVTPCKRGALAAGKIGALAIIALLSGMSSTLGTLLSLPKLMGGMDGASASMYTSSDYLMLAGIILSTVLLFVALISILSAFAKTVKEAQMLVMPLMIVVMFASLTGMFSEGAASGTAAYFIPIYNSVQCLIGVFSFESSAVHIAITIVSNIVYTAIGTFVIAKMFNSEKIMFKR